MDEAASRQPETFALVLGLPQRELGIDVVRECSNLKAVLLGGAVLPPAFKRWITDTWQVRVIEIYGSNETMLLAIGCPEGGLQLASDDGCLAHGRGRSRAGPRARSCFKMTQRFVVRCEEFIDRCASPLVTPP